jgi:hypothetical protein
MRSCNDSMVNPALSVGYPTEHLKSQTYKIRYPCRGCWPAGDVRQDTRGIKFRYGPYRSASAFCQNALSGSGTCGNRRFPLPFSRLGEAVVWHPTCFTKFGGRPLSRWIRPHQRKKLTMPGWIIIFAVLFLLGLTSALAGNPLGLSLAPKLITGMSGTLLLACLVTRIVRRA